MEQINPYSSASQAIDALDNGGKFYNIFTKADDDLISQSEVSKVAGAGFQKQKGVLFLQLAMSKLSEREQLEVIGIFDDNLLENYNKYKPEEITSYQAFNGLNAGTGIVVNGIPKKIDSEGIISGYISIPVIDVFTLIPISETYIVYEIKDEETGVSILVAHEKESATLPEVNMKLSGVIKQFQLTQDEESDFEKFIEIEYYVGI